ncbi:hypothetical protein A3F08_00025 [Candidatus Berkelbacteria bacterium RIFCSPHIGHO2_12_FULL_36_9]|uniref:BSD domain-containing protein n=1 Tax=Candidatus Berkelbacteria bacterium RIFCSPHIGHO2_12_FULL_36_9 TaxID=1797469 RepID=A0A1F5EEQ8_9BACT|nr:MAG: hypothetical protein A3F08_00025 [Candidatus Berkelbacteria bacterium RIFCSPHIGHO2_12_FULL_36_9]
MEKEEEIKILNLMVENEESIGRLYSEYAEKFSQHSEFWNHIFKEELIHAQWIKALYGKVDSGKVVFNKNHFPSDIVEKTLSFIKQKIEETKKDELPLMTALNIALKIEKGMIENNYFGVFNTDTGRFKKVLDDLAQGTRDHIRDIESKKMEVETYLNVAK